MFCSRPRALPGRDTAEHLPQSTWHLAVLRSQLGERGRSDLRRPELENRIRSKNRNRYGVWEAEEERSRGECPEIIIIKFLKIKDF